jgi:uncharacterized membrane protein YedE/YeeE
MMPAQLVALGAGLVFALGLGIAGMTDPSKVLAFLDVGGDWDPSLAFVMVGAIAVHAALLRAHKRAEPYLASRFDAPANARVDAPLLLGAALFGLGWGASGFCPGPALVSLVTFAPGTWLFGAGMLVGISAVNLLRHARRGLSPDGSPAA